MSLTPKVSVCALKSPLSEKIAPSVLFLEISSTEKYFGSESNVLNRAGEILDELSWEGQAVVTDRPEWGLPLAIQNRSFAAPGQSRKVLQALPIQRLDYCGDPWKISDEMEERVDLTAFLKKVGLRYIADFLKLPLPSVQKRFGKMGAGLHDWASGKRELVLPLFFPTEPIRENAPTDDIAGLDSLLYALKEILARIETRLKGRALSATKIEIQYSLESKQVLRQRVTLKEPVQQAHILWGLLRDFLQNSQQEWNSPLQDLEVGVLESIPEPKGQLSLFDDSEKKLAELSEFISRLQARLGEDRAGVAECMPSYLPERSTRLVWPHPKSRQTVPQSSCPLSRPFFLYDKPRPCLPTNTWKLIPTEKLTESWWETDKPSEAQERVYFIAHTPKGDRLWVFWSKKLNRWFIHGVYE